MLEVPGSDRNCFGSRLPTVPTEPAAPATTLSVVPVFVRETFRLASGREVLSPGPVWLSRSEADEGVIKRRAIILTACSVLSSAKAPSGFVVHPRSELLALPLSDAEPLETAGAVRILRSDTDLAAHRAAWAKLAEDAKEMRARAHQLRAEADELLRRASSPTLVPSVFDWPDAKGRKKA